MATQKRWLVGLDDIRELRFECKKCGATVGFRPGSWQSGGSNLVSCENCKSDWINPLNVGTEVKLLVESIERLLSGEDRFGCKIMLEFDGSNFP